VERYHKIPSQILGITNNYDAFCFDEAIAYIQSYMYYDYEDDGKLKWRKTPHWIDEVAPKNNEEVAKLIQKQMQKYNR